MDRPTIACLLPVRNGADELPGWFASVGQFADIVVALDDGSTDDTRAILESHPLVVRTLGNPRRDTYVGWDDAANRNALLRACDEIRPRWIVSLDVDERIDADDAAALRAAVEGGLDHAFAYLFRVYRMIGDAGQWDRANLWVGRMFSWQSGQRLPDDKFHFVPLPANLPSEMWRRTTIRIQHRASMTEQRRQERHGKYVLADPNRDWQDSYEQLLRPPGDLQSWQRRPPGLPFVWHDSSTPVPAPAPGIPALSAIVISLDDEDRIRGCLDALLAQRADEPFEVVVVNSGADDTAAIVAGEYPDVRLVKLASRALPGAARNAGLAVARGQFVSFPGSHVRAEPGYVQATIDAHRRGWAMVSGSIENGTKTWAGWSNYFLDHSAKLPGRPAQKLPMYPAAASYRCDALRAMGGFPDLRAGEDTDVNALMWESGYGAWFSPRKKLIHDTPCRTPVDLLRHHAVRGGGFSQRLLREHEAGRLFTRSGLRRHLVVWVPGRLARIVRNVRRDGTGSDKLRLAWCFPLAAVSAMVHWGSGWMRALTQILRLRRPPVRAPSAVEP